MPKGIKIVGWIMVVLLSLVSLISGLDRREVSYFVAFAIPIVLIGGWIIALIATRQPNPEPAQHTPERTEVVRHPGRGLARGIGIAMIIIGALTFYSIAGIFSLLIGIGLMRFKRQSHVNAIILMWVEIVASSLALVVGIVLLVIAYAQIVTVSMRPIIDTYFSLVVAGIVGLVISVPLLILLKRPSVREVYWQSPA
jgi:hypothetical protein